MMMMIIIIIDHIIIRRGPYHRLKEIEQVWTDSE
jgi:hypothetical protein